MQVKKFRVAIKIRLIASKSEENKYYQRKEDRKEEKEAKDGNRKYKIK